MFFNRRRSSCSSGSILEFVCDLILRNCMFSKTFHVLQLYFNFSHVITLTVPKVQNTDPSDYP